MKNTRYFLGFLSIALAAGFAPKPGLFTEGHPNAFGRRAAERPNVLLIYTDDVGYGDLGCYGAMAIKTPNIDRLARQGLRFTDAHTSSASCTPSRYSLMTGEYAWRRSGTGIAPGDAAALIQPGRTTLPGVFERAGYTTGVVGKWHLGLGPPGGPDWNGEIKPGPLEIGFDKAFIIPATQDRVPCVYVRDHRVVGLDSADPITVSYKDPVGDEPTGKDHPERLKQKLHHGHDQTIINGVSRIGYMRGGKAARWVDEDMADVLTRQAIEFIEQNSRAKANTFFLYLATTDIHVPRMPHARFVGKSGLGARGDVILQLDWLVGEVLKTLDRLKLTDNTIIVFSSDNGPVLNDGYYDDAVNKLGSHRPAGPLRGGKYSAFEAGTRVPLLVRWPGKVKAGTSDALVSQVDFLASFAALVNQPLAPGSVVDSENQLDALLGKTRTGRTDVVEHSGAFSLTQGRWKYIEPNSGPAVIAPVGVETGNNAQPQLYDLRNDLGETTNAAAANPELVKTMASRLRSIRDKEKRQQ